MTEIERLAFAWLEAGDALTAAKPAGKLEANRYYTEAQIALYRALRTAKSEQRDAWKPDLFVAGPFQAHSGGRLPFKIECDSLTDGDIACLAEIIAGRFRFTRVRGVPRGGLRLARALERYCGPAPGIALLVDDVLTTGRSMEEARESWRRENAAALAAGMPSARDEGQTIKGCVLFARGPCPDWVSPIFAMELAP